MGPKDLRTQALQEADFLASITARNKAMLTEASMRESSLLGTNRGPDPRDLEIARLREESARRDADAREAKLRTEFNQGLAEIKSLIVSSPKENGKGLEVQLFGKVIATLAERALAPPPPPPDPFLLLQRAFETSRAYASMSEPTPVALDMKKLDIAMQKYMVDRQDEKAFELAKLEAQRAESVLNRGQFSDLVGMARDTIESSLKPIAEKLGDGLAMRIGTGGNPSNSSRTTPRPRPDYLQMSSEDRARAKGELRRIAREVQEEEVRVFEAERASAVPAQPPQEETHEGST